MANPKPVARALTRTHRPLQDEDLEIPNARAVEHVEALGADRVAEVADAPSLGHTRQARLSCQDTSRRSVTGFTQFLHGELVSNAEIPW